MITNLEAKQLASTAAPALSPAAAYINDLTLTVLAMRTGTGKSVILCHCIVEALSRTDATSILIRYGVKEIPASILNQCTIINATVNHKEEVVLSELNGAFKRVIICSLNSDFSFREREKVFCAALTKLISSLSDGFLNKLRFFLIDDCHRIGWSTLSAAIEDTYRHLSERGGATAKIVVSCQELPRVDELPSLPTSVISDSGTMGYEFFERVLAGYTAQLQFHLADDFDGAVDFGDHDILIKNIATFALWNVHKYRSPDSRGISLSLIDGGLLNHLKSISDKIFGFAKDSNSWGSIFENSAPIFRDRSGNLIPTSEVFQPFDQTTSKTIFAASGVVYLNGSQSKEFTAFIVRLGKIVADEGINFEVVADAPIGDSINLTFSSDQESSIDKIVRRARRDLLRRNHIDHGAWREDGFTFEIAKSFIVQPQCWSLCFSFADRYRFTENYQP